MFIVLGLAPQPAQSARAAAAAPGTRFFQQGSANFAGCTDATIREIKVPAGTAIDQIRIDVRPSTKPTVQLANATRVELRAGGFSRVTHTFGGGGLRFSPALRGDTFELSLDPVFSAKAGACITEITLISDGKEIAKVRP